MDIELRLREVHAIHDPGVHVTDSVMARVEGHSVAKPAGGVASLADARARYRRRFILVTTVLAVAVAAAMLVLDRDSAPKPQIVAAPVMVPAVIPPAASPPVVLSAAAAPAPQPVPVAPRPVAAMDLRDLPLFPPRPRSITDVMKDEALLKAVERHPELVEGPATDSTFHVVLVMRRNGGVVDSAARLGDRRDSGAILNELKRLIPQDGMASRTSSTNGSWRRQALLPDGRALRADVLYQLGVVADDYDASDPTASRSSAKVEEMLRARYAHLLLPSSGGEVNRLTVLLTEGGEIEREKVQLVNPAEARKSARVPQMPRDAAEAGNLIQTVVAGMAERMAGELGIEVDRIGAIDNLRLQDGINGVTEDANGMLRSVGQPRSLLVTYAWPRRAGESGPSMVGLGSPAQLAQQLQQELRQTETRLAPAITIVERLMPDAFTLSNADAGIPLIALTAKGEVIAAIRLNTRGNEQPGPGAINRELKRLHSGFQRGSISTTETLRNGAGAAAEVKFAWLPDEPAPGTNGK